MLLKVYNMHSAYFYIPSLPTLRLNSGQLLYFPVNLTGKTPGGNWMVTSSSEEVSICLIEASSPAGHLISKSLVKNMSWLRDTYDGST